MRLLSTRTNAIFVANHKNKGRLGCQAQEQGKKRLRSIGTMTIEVVKHTNNGK